MVLDEKLVTVDEASLFHFHVVSVLLHGVWLQCLPFNFSYFEPPFAKVAEWPANSGGMDGNFSRRSRSRDKDQQLFVFKASRIKDLKQKYVVDNKSVSCVEALSAFIWNCFVVV
ncbi:hypothetical protein F8388_006200 [Cannabis sativa]|uniref:Uncharacterized protein n=1 Tax=Cannabis sativa TaxID=3483 RepID=A0A7J6G9H7_CANSA|nr:hypothetical protein F8388_006200 [Cannabis sativa]